MFGPSYVCRSCGKRNPSHNTQCQYCGAARSASLEGFSVGGAKPNSGFFGETEDNPGDDVLAYLEKIGMLQCADREYQIKIQLEDGQIVSVPLLGRHRSNDAMEYLRVNGYLVPFYTFRFANWPDADPCIGPWYHHISACACELREDRIYHLERYDSDDIRMLYGCPNPRTDAYGKVLDQARIVVVDYEKKDES